MPTCGQVLLGDCLGILADFAVGGAVLQDQLDAVFITRAVAVAVHPAGFVQQLPWLFPDHRARG